MQDHTCVLASLQACSSILPQHSPNTSNTATEQQMMFSTLTAMSPSNLPCHLQTCKHMYRLRCILLVISCHEIIAGECTTICHTVLASLSAGRCYELWGAMTSRAQNEVTCAIQQLLMSLSIETIGRQPAGYTANSLHHMHPLLDSI